MIGSGDFSKEKDTIFFRCVENTYDTVMVTNTKGVLVYVNRAWEKLYGYSREEALGQTPRLIRSGHQTEAFYKAMWADILDPAKGHWRGELVNRAKDGREVPILLTIWPYKDTLGITRGYMGISLDMTERKRLEEQVIHQDRLASLGLLASGLAHEIGTPLGVIRGRAEYLALQLRDRPNLRGDLDTIVSQIDRISKLIYSLLHLSRTSENSETATPVKVEAVVREVANLMTQEVRRSGIDLALKVDPAAQVRAEPDRLEQVLLNLVVNSVHAIETAMKIGRVSGHAIRISTAEMGNGWEISVADTGCGIKPEVMANLFKPFFTTKDVGVGTGLGLTIAYQILKSWGGSIAAKSDGTTGAEFRITLPKA